MARYHLYFLRHGMLVGSDSIEATDDGDAIRRARAQAGDQVIEVWNDHRRVQVIAPTEHSLS